MTESFVTAVLCIDGRFRRCLVEWVAAHFGIDYVDLVTEPGPDRVLAEDSFGPRQTGSEVAWRFRELRTNPPRSSSPVTTTVLATQSTRGSIGSKIDARSPCCGSGTPTCQSLGCTWTPSAPYT